MSIPHEMEWPAHLPPPRQVEPARTPRESFEHRLVLEALRTELDNSASRWRYDTPEHLIRVGRAREHQLIAEAERDAVRVFEARRQQRNRATEQWASYRAQTRARLPHA
jgi:hypothetical protein